MEEKKLNAGKEMIKRLRRIEGQVKGIQKMVEEDKNCGDILIQVAAVRAAINKVGGLILENYAMSCINNIVSSNDKEKEIDILNSTIQNFMGFRDQLEISEDSITL
jgi:CsoR family transcriptional regulator, copper-sensing transcriptional repressor